MVSVTSCKDNHKHKTKKLIGFKMAVMQQEVEEKYLGSLFTKQKLGLITIHEPTITQLRSLYFLFFFFKGVLKGELMG